MNRKLFAQLSSGVIVIRVEKGGTSHEAGIYHGDIIISIDGKQFKNATELDILLLRSSSGKVSYYDVLRRTEKKSI
ncbi:MAG: PDZ domain-containing protein [Candidatus Kapaibacteriales bacterium]